MAKVKSTNQGTVPLHASLGLANAAAAIDTHAVAPVAAGRSNWVVINGVAVDIAAANMPEVTS